MEALPASRRALILVVVAVVVYVVAYHAVALLYSVAPLYRGPGARRAEGGGGTATATATASPRPAAPVHVPRRHPGMVFSELPEHLRSPRWDVASEHVVNLTNIQFESFFRIAVERTGYLVIEYKTEKGWWWETRLYVEAVGLPFYRIYEMYFMGTGYLYDYTYMERGYTLFKINIAPLLGVLERHGRNAVVEVFPSVTTITGETIICRLFYNHSRRSLEVARCDVYDGRYSCGDICLETIVGPLLSSFTDGIRSVLVSEVLNNRVGWDPYELALYIRDWFARYTRYEKDHEQRRHTYHALEFYIGKEGVCRDYAVFAAAVLGAGGVREVYLLQFRVPSGELHMVTGVEVNGSLYIIDMKRPVLEWNSYVRSVWAPLNERMVVFRLRLDERGDVMSLEAAWVKPERYMEEETARAVYYGEKPEETAG